MKGCKAEVQCIKEELSHFAIGAMGGEVPWSETSSIFGNDDVHIRLRGCIISVSMW